MNKRVAVLGATDDPMKYSNRALHMLMEHGYEPIPINPRKQTVDGMTCYSSLKDMPADVDTVTVYVRPEISSTLIDDVLAAKPRRVILNPGAHNDKLSAECAKSGIEVVEGCTLVMLGTGSF
jgi:uncharacterized protein